jgi:uncharacterized DUF497 family protein
MTIFWDELKRIENLRIHKFDFRDAWKVFNGLELTFEDDRFPYPERRLQHNRIHGGTNCQVVLLL